MFQDIAAAVPIGFFLAFLLGPVFFVLLETAALKGFRAAFFLDLGVIFADIVFLIIAYFSTSRLLNIIKDDPALFIFGGGVLVTFGIISLINQRKVLPHQETTELRKSKKSDYLGLAIKGFLLNFVNIGVLGFWLGLIIVFGPTMKMDPQRLLVFFSSVLATYLIIDIFKILLAKKLNHKLTPIRIYRIKKWISILIIVFGTVLIVRGIFPSKLERIDGKFDIFKEE